MILVDGNPAISYYDRDNGALKYVRCLLPQGIVWGIPDFVDLSDDVGLYTSMLIVDGKPAISYYDDTRKDLRFVKLY